MNEYGHWLPVVLVVIAFVVAVAWVFMPFAIFGTKDILRSILKEQQRTNEILDDRLPALRRRE